MVTNFIPVDEKGFRRWINTFGRVSDEIISLNYRLNQQKFKVYLKKFNGKEINKIDVQSLLSSLNDQILFFTTLVPQLDGHYRHLKDLDTVLRKDEFIFDLFEDLLAQMRGLLLLYNEEREALSNDNVNYFFELFNQERKLYKRIAKFLNSIKPQEIVLAVQRLSPEDKRGSSLVFTAVALLFVGSLVAPGCFNEKLGEGFREIGRGSGLIGSSVWNDAIVPISNWVKDGINLLGYHVPNWAAGLSVLVLAVLGLMAVVSKLRD